jgi:hypothetical protein
VDKVAGKGLSSEDYTAEEKSKLSGIEPCAEVNAVAGISVNGGDPVYPNGGKIIPLEVATGITELPDTVPKNRGQWSSSTVYAKGDLVYKTWNSPAAKLWYLSLADGNVNHTPLLPNWTTDVMYWECLNAVSGTVRTYINPNLSFPRGILLGGHKDNQEDFNSVYWDKKVYSQEGKVYDTRGELAAMSDIPTMLPANGGDANTVDGFHSSDFATAEQGAAGEQALAGLDGKVDKIAGKGLSTEDYTAEEKSKLSGIESGAEVNEVTEAPLDGKQYARKDGEWDEISVEELPEGIWTNKGAWTSAATYRKGDVVSGDTATYGASVSSTWVSLADGNAGNRPPDNESNAYWQIVGSYGISGFIGRCRYPELTVTGLNGTTLNKKRGLILTDVDPYNATGIWSTLAVLRPTTGQITSEADNDYIVYEKGGELYDARGKLAAQSEIRSEGKKLLTVSSPSKVINGKRVIVIDNLTNILPANFHGKATVAVSAPASAGVISGANSLSNEFAFGFTDGTNTLTTFSGSGFLMRYGMCELIADLYRVNLNGSKIMAEIKIATTCGTANAEMTTASKYTVSQILQRQTEGSGHKLCIIAGDDTMTEADGLNWTVEIYR